MTMIFRISMKTETTFPIIKEALNKNTITTMCPNLRISVSKRNYSEQ